jgi:hypothetical protein
LTLIPNLSNRERSEVSPLAQLVYSWNKKLAVFNAEEAA